MLQPVHLCFTSHKEVMYRNADDMNTAFNSLCSALCKTGSKCLAETFITTHHHGAYYSECPYELARTARSSYTRQFNDKYDRKGPLGDPGYFIATLEGTQHLITALVYIIRNVVHHGIAATPFSYPYSSANAYFREELGKNHVPELLLSPAQIQKVLPRRAMYDPSWKMGVEGVFLRESVLEVVLVENLFATPQAFNYLLSRKSAADWYKEQEKDGNGVPPITLEDMEKAVIRFAPSREKTITEMLQNEKARFGRNGMTDLELCKLIDTEYVPKYSAQSVYQLSGKTKTAIANDLYRRFHSSVSQISRCLAI